MEFTSSGGGFRDRVSGSRHTFPIVENLMEKKMEHDMTIGIIHWSIRLRFMPCLP